MKRRVIVVGAGPAGLATAIRAAEAGVQVEVLERRALPLDKACGEGVLPAGLAVLRRLGVDRHLNGADCSELRGVRYVQEDGSFAEALLPEAGLGIRRTALSAALRARALELGVEIQERTRVLSVSPGASSVSVSTEEGSREAAFLVAADGLGSPIRNALKLEGKTSGPRRFGLRQHFRAPQWTDFVEVHLASGVEAYVTPAGADRVGVAFLFEQGLEPRPSVSTLLQRFPHLGARLLDATPDSEAKGAGPLLRPVRTPFSGRVALVGDAAGYVDAVTGEGLSLGLSCAEALGACLPAVLEGRPGALKPFLATYEREFRTYALATHAILAVARRPRLRRQVVGILTRAPRVFTSLVRLVTKPRSAPRASP